MRYKRTLVHILVCLAGLGCGRIFTWALMRCLLYYYWPNDGSVELDYIHPLVMNKVDDYSAIYDVERRVRILCWAFIGNGDRNDAMRQKFGHISVTWAQKCTKVVYISDGNLNLIVKDKGQHKIVRALKYLQRKQNLTQYDWIVKFDANVYIIMENLRHFLLPYTTAPFNMHLLGHASYVERSRDKSLPQNSMLILNIHAVDRVVASINYAACQSAHYPYDMDNCLAFNNVSSITFNYVSNYADDVLREEVTNDGKRKTKIVKELKHCCHHMSIYFYNVKPNEMYAYEYFLYSARPVGYVPVFGDTGR